MSDYNVELNRYSQPTSSYDQLYPQTKTANIIGYKPGFLPRINVTTDATAVVTCTDGKTTLTETADSEGKCYFDVPGFGTWTLSAVKGGDTSDTVEVVVDEVKVYGVELGFVKIYGAEWAATADTKWVRTDNSEFFPDPNPAIANGTGSSPFDNLYPWNGMKRVSDPVCGELVSIPKFYYKWTKVGNGLKLQIANKKVEGFLVSPAHMDRGDGKGERDIVYVGRYHCSNNNWKSVSGHNPKNDVTRSQARSSIHGLGSTIWQWDWHMHMTIWMLYLVEFADWNCQTAIGYGCGNNSGVEAVGKTDGMKYCTGTRLGNRTTYGVGVQYRYIEGLWDNVRDWVDGCYYNASGLNVINNPAKFSDTANGTPAGVPTSGYPSKFEVKTVNGFQVIYPIQSSGSDSTYTCDYWGFSASNPCLYVGGNYYQGLSYGIGHVNDSGVSYSDALIGPRLMKLP